MCADLARIDEHRGVERPPRFPLVFSAHRDGLAISKARVRETAQRLRAADVRHVDHRNAREAVGAGQRRLRAQLQPPVAIAERDDLLQVDVDAPKVRAIVALAIEARGRDLIVSAAPRMRRTVAPVEAKRRVGADELRQASESGSG